MVFSISFRVTKVLVISLLLTGMVYSLQAQDYPEIYRPSSEGGFDMLPGHLVRFRNSDSEKVNFSLSFDGENYRRFTVYRNDPLTINLKKRTTAYFRVCTSGKDDCVGYRLKGSELYRIFWNRDKRKWDLLRVDQ